MISSLEKRLESLQSHVRELEKDVSELDYNVGKELAWLRSAVETLLQERVRLVARQEALEERLGRLRRRKDI
jgi:hypothetical protein